MSKPVCLWDRQDGQGPPKVIAKSRPAPGEGCVWIVHALDDLPGRLVDRARRTLAMSKVDVEGMSHREAGPYLDAKAAVELRDEE